MSSSPACRSAGRGFTSPWSGFSVVPCRANFSVAAWTSASVRSTTGAEGLGKCVEEVVLDLHDLLDVVEGSVDELDRTRHAGPGRPSACCSLESALHLLRPSSQRVEHCLLALVDRVHVLLGHLARRFSPFRLAEYSEKPKMQSGALKPSGPPRTQGRSGRPVVGYSPPSSQTS